MNFLFGVPQWCVSVAVHDDDGGLAGVVFDPLRDEIFVGSRDGGLPTLNGAEVRGSQRADLATALDRHRLRLRRGGARACRPQSIARLLPQVRDVRRMGSAALDLAWTAAGRYDAFYERGVQIWDIAAGACCARRRGWRCGRSRPTGARPRAWSWRRRGCSRRWRSSWRRAGPREWGLSKWSRELRRSDEGRVRCGEEHERSEA